MPSNDSVTRKPLPIILIRGFGGLDVEDEQALTYQGFNVGTVYPQKRGENYIYEGFILRLMKSELGYRDATNVVGYYPRDVHQARKRDGKTEKMPDECFAGDRVIMDAAMAESLLTEVPDPLRTIWVLRYYDLGDRTLERYGKALKRLIELIQAVAQCAHGESTKVNVIAHSLGGLIVRQCVQITYPKARRKAETDINKIVTLGTPHQGVSFQVLSQIGWLPIGASNELEAFSPDKQADKSFDLSFKNFAKHFPTGRMLTVVGTSYRSYDVGVASFLNRLFSQAGEGGRAYNRSDGLVKITNAQVPSCPRTFVHKCHGGPDSLVTARESYEVATRFFHGNVRIRLRLLKGKVLRGMDWIGRSEFFFGVSVKPRFVDFELFHQSREAENCYGPFNDVDLNKLPDDTAFGWAGPNRLIWEGFLKIKEDNLADDSGLTLMKRNRDMVFRTDFYIGERDTFGVGFSDNVVYRKQYYVRVVQTKTNHPPTLWLYNGEDFEGGRAQARTASKARNEMQPDGEGWVFEVKGTGFEGKLRIELDWVPEVGSPMPMKVQSDITET